MQLRRRPFSDTENKVHFTRGGTKVAIVREKDGQITIRHWYTNKDKTRWCKGGTVDVGKVVWARLSYKLGLLFVDEESAVLKQYSRLSNPSHAEMCTEVGKLMVKVMMSMMDPESRARTNELGYMNLDGYNAVVKGQHPIEQYLMPKLDIETELRLRSFKPNYMCSKVQTLLDSEHYVLKHLCKCSDHQIRLWLQAEKIQRNLKMERLLPFWCKIRVSAKDLKRFFSGFSSWDEEFEHPASAFNDKSFRAFRVYFKHHKEIKIKDLRHYRQIVNYAPELEFKETPLERVLTHGDQQRRYKRCESIEGFVVDHDKLIRTYPGILLRFYDPIRTIPASVRPFFTKKQVKRALTKMVAQMYAGVLNYPDQDGWKIILDCTNMEGYDEFTRFNDSVCLRLGIQCSEHIVARMNHRVAEWMVNNRARITELDVWGYMDEIQEAHLLNRLGEFDPNKSVVRVKDEIVARREEMRREREAKEAAIRDIVMEPINYPVSLAGQEVEQILTYDRIEEEGTNLSHCVAGYWKSVAEGRYFVFHVKASKDADAFTIGIFNNGHLDQAYGKYNKSITGKQQKALETWLVAVREEIKNAK